MYRLSIIFIFGFSGFGAYAESSGMPQLDSSTYASQLFWLSLTFIILFLLMSRVALPRVSEVLNLRANKIRQDLELAERLKVEAESLQENIDERLLLAHTQSQEVIRRAQDEANRYAIASSERVEREIEVMLSEALDNIAVARAKVSSDIDASVLLTAKSIARALSGVEVSDKVVEQAFSSVRKLQ